MEPTRVLVVANRTAATPLLLDEVRRRAGEGPCQFTLLIPDADARTAGDWTLDIALPQLERAAGAPVHGLVSGPYPLESVYDALRAGDYDEVIVSTLSRRFSRWLHRDLPGRIRALGLPVTVVAPDGRVLDHRATASVFTSDQ
jgi:hypothetical protein